MEYEGNQQPGLAERFVQRASALGNFVVGSPSRISAPHPPIRKSWKEGRVNVIKIPSAEAPRLAFTNAPISISLHAVEIALEEHE